MQWKEEGFSENAIELTYPESYVSNKMGTTLAVQDLSIEPVASTSTPLSRKKASAPLDARDVKVEAW